MRALDEEYAALDWSEWVGLPPATGRNGDVLHSISLNIRVPRVVQLLVYDRTPQVNIKFTRANIYLRDKYRCQYCGRSGKSADLNIDHMIPRSRGGSSDWENVVVACVSCNRRKGNRLPEEVGMKLARIPRRPRWQPVISLSQATQPHPQWRPFLEITYQP